MVSEEKNMVNCEIRECKFLESDDVLKEIRRLIGESDEVRIAVAYLKEKGYNEIKDALREFLEKEKHFFWLLVGIAKYYITDADPLDELLELQRKNKNIKLKCSPNCGFHPKVCIFRTGKDVSVIIGSSNLTGGGLGENTEANILIRGDEGDEVIKNILNFYYRIWQWPDFGLLDKRILDIYRKNKENKKRFDRKFESGRGKKSLPEKSLPPQPESEGKGFKGFEPEDFENLKQIEKRNKSFDKDMGKYRSEEERREAQRLAKEIKGRMKKFKEELDKTCSKKLASLDSDICNIIERPKKGGTGKYRSHFWIWYCRKSYKEGRDKYAQFQVTITEEEEVYPGLWFEDPRVDGDAGRLIRYLEKNPLSLPGYTMDIFGPEKEEEVTPENQDEFIRKLKDLKEGLEAGKKYKFGIRKKLKKDEAINMREEIVSEIKDSLEKELYPLYQIAIGKKMRKAL